ncbi:unnamed protein product [Clonostachys rosea f. rosea IK726]|uniref:Major facilitator superfamily (MFS) profile domain-containing protein n=2 Tax=Bionectria ochroleuca TaxID=29856 RepID=A0A0B7JJ85_BIOOC|nr:unnamed protein product [Clonostachys rosea f. rosea IK726]
MDGHPTTSNLYDDVLPGTKRIFTDENASTSDESLIEKDGDVILVPRPTNSPNDPLRWSRPRKVLHSVIVCYIVALTAATSNIAGVASTGVEEEYGISYDYFNTGAGVLFLAIGYWTLLSSPLVHLYGRRIGYILSALLGFGGNLWFGYLSSTNDTIWSQLFVGASESVAESVVQLSLLDIWFEHQNGTSLGFYTLATSVGTYLGPLIAGYIAHDESVGWRWIGYFGAIISAGTLVLTYFCLEETAFDRNRYLRVEEQRASNNTIGLTAPETNDEPNEKTTETKQVAPVDGAVSPVGTNIEGEKTAVSEKPPVGVSATDVERDSDGLSVGYTERKTYWQRIRLITPARNLRGTGFMQYLHRLWHTLRVFTFPAVWYAGLQWGMQNIALSFYLTVEEDTWTDEPWFYDDAAVANMNLACIIGSVIGCFYGGYCSDKFMLWRSRRNRGIMEAEFRLHLMMLCMAIFPTGMWLFGIGSAKGWSWPVPYVGLGFIGFGYGCAGDLSITYLADCYPDMVLEGMVGVAVINNTLAMIFTFVASYWLDTGIQECFIALGVLSFVILGLSLPMMWWGKRFRSWTKTRYLNYLQIRDGLDD